MQLIYLDKVIDRVNLIFFFFKNKNTKSLQAHLSIN
jgi:hypothetical protein